MASSKTSAWVSLNNDNVVAKDDKKDVNLSNDKRNNTIEGVENGWFTETQAMWPGQKFSLALEEFSLSKALLFSETSEFQSVLVFRSAQYGNVLVLDGVIQMTERDEFAYHEMMVHLPLCASTAEPASILIVGGGDGGALREVVTHYDKSIVKEIVVVEIDPMVAQVAKTYLGAAEYFDDDRVTVIYQDAATYLADPSLAGKFQVILGDTSDPVGPAESLFQPEFYVNMYNALSTGGIVCVQAECFWIHLELISDLVACCSEIFDTAEYATAMVPTYPCGQIGFILARKEQPGKKTGSARVPVRRPAHMEKLKWYSRDIHHAAFVLPPFVTKELEGYQDEDVVGRSGSFFRNFLPTLKENGNGQYDDSQGDEEDDDEKYKCFLNNAMVLPSFVKNTFSSFSDKNGEDASEGVEEKKCFVCDPPQQCTIQ